MVKVAFIVEGECERMLIESANFQTWVKAQGLEICRPVIDAKGGGNLLPQHLDKLLAQFKSSQPDHIVILTDLEDAPSTDSVKARITTTHTQLIFVAVKALEAWFLADTDTMCKWLNAPDFLEPAPETTPGMPWDRVKALAQTYERRGPGTKVKFANIMCNKLGYQVANAAKHPGCPSAKLFCDALAALGTRHAQLP